MRIITISGNLGRNPEMRQTNSGINIANFSIAVRRTRADADGSYSSDWFNCAVFGKRADTVQQYFHKGDHVTLSGDLTISQFKGRDGVDRTQLGIDVCDFDLPERQSNRQAPDSAIGDQVNIDDNSLPF